MIELKNVSCGYGKGFVVKDISFALDTGGRMCVLGPNGSGKSTLVRAMAGILEYTGELTVDGLRLVSMSRKNIAKKIAVVTQVPTFYFPYTVYEVAAFGRYAWKDGLFGGESAVDREWVCAALDAVGIYELRDRPVSELSGGQFQKVFLAKAFAQNPEIMLLDEPTNHLDIKSQYEFMERLFEWAEKGEKTVAAVLHDINFAVAHFSNVLLMDNGRAAYCGEARELMGNGLLDRVFGVDVRGKMVASLNNWG
jgi:iron complex transport system ATP-binding protein